MYRQRCCLSNFCQPLAIGLPCQHAPDSSSHHRTPPTWTMTAQPEHGFLLPAQDLMGWMFCEPNPIAVNTALAMCGLVKPVFRLPYVPLSTEQRRRGVELLQPLLAHIPGADGVREMADGDFTVLANF